VCFKFNEYDLIKNCISYNLYFFLGQEKLSASLYEKCQDILLDRFIHISL